MAPREQFIDCTVAKGPKTLKDCPRRPAGSARPRLLRSRDIRPRFSSIFCSSYACETARPGQSGHWRLPMLARNLPGRLGTGRRSFLGPRLATGRQIPQDLVSGTTNRVSTGLVPAAGTIIPLSSGVSASASLRTSPNRSCKSRLHLALMLRVLSWRRSGLDRDRGAHANQTKKGEPHRPGHSRSQRPCRLDRM